MTNLVKELIQRLCKKSANNKIVVLFHTTDIRRVPLSKHKEYLDNIERYKSHHWTELVSPDSNGYFIGLNGSTYFADIAFADGKLQIHYTVDTVNLKG